MILLNLLLYLIIGISLMASLAIGIFFLGFVVYRTIFKENGYFEEYFGLGIIFLMVIAICLATGYLFIHGVLR